jgi:hypothetical protein
VRNEELEVTRPTPGGGVSDLGVGIIRGPHHRTVKKACRFRKKSESPKWKLFDFPCFSSVLKVAVLKYRVPLLGFLPDYLVFIVY